MRVGGEDTGLSREGNSIRREKSSSVFSSPHRVKKILSIRRCIKVPRVPFDYEGVIRIYLRTGSDDGKGKRLINRIRSEGGSGRFHCFQILMKTLRRENKDVSWWDGLMESRFEEGR